MFIFYESTDDIKDILPDSYFRKYPWEYIECHHHFTFDEAIKCLATNRAVDGRIERPATLVIKNFFSVGCKYISGLQARGLERIALSDNAWCISNRYWPAFIPTTETVGGHEQFVRAQNYFTNKTCMHGIGNFKKGNTLIVGDCPGKKSQGLNTPFVGSGSGQWLLKQLNNFLVDENKYFWVNAKDGFGKPTPTDFVKDLEPEEIIALGNKAYEWARKIGNYKVTKVPHPAYWMRFHNKERYPLMDLLTYYSDINFPYLIK